MASLPASGSSAPIRLVAGSTVAEFVWGGDRWRHEVTTAAGRWVSVEGAGDAGDPRWPASPPLVEVSLVEVAGRPAVLAVGLAGRSHFSLSAAAGSPGDDTILFEAACRIHEPAGWLGSTYLAAGGEVVRLAASPAPPPATVAWRYTIGPRGIVRADPAPRPAPG